jgi:hypothetical protein
MALPEACHPSFSCIKAACRPATRPNTMARSRATAGENDAVGFDFSAIVQNHATDSARLIKARCAVANDDDVEGIH